MLIHIAWEILVATTQLLDIQSMVYRHYFDRDTDTHHWVLSTCIIKGDDHTYSVYNTPLEHVSYDGYIERHHELYLQDYVINTLALEDDVQAVRGFENIVPIEVDKDGAGDALRARSDQAASQGGIDLDQALTTTSS